VITVLAVGERERAGELDGLAARNPSLELLHATGVEEALDRLARNRRIDAVLLLVDPAAAREIEATLLDEDPAGPPIFVAAAGQSAQELLDAIARNLRASE
jgi:hypothetical protein